MSPGYDDAEVSGTLPRDGTNRTNHGFPVDLGGLNKVSPCPLLPSWTIVVTGRDDLGVKKKKFYMHFKNIRKKP